ncbi:histidine kinase [Dactylosporangium sp. AC04546]|uniref:sensor histidine kinase n=1 Tax=Dactylosporangium sp. AC04546 TaxID=2862460 RepID=UPI001EDCCDFB|nr:histidine kinase [Dactylosporangium sp. AC04546]WVK85917.1 histidine kinase [Dactylosporangium sp. AC04546]
MHRVAAYLLAGPIVAALWLAVVGGLYAVGIVVQFAPVGALFVLAGQFLLRPIGRVERRLARTLLGVDVPAPAPLAPPGTVWWRRLGAVFLDPHGWRVLAWILIRCATWPAALVYPPLAGWYRRLAVRLLGPTQAEILRERAERAEAQVRLDQELHDSIGHLLSMIVVQAGAGAHLFDRDPAFARNALRTIQEQGRSALGELDRIIAGLRPQGVPDVETLLDGAASAGLRVHRRVRLGPLPAAVGQGIHRVLQEALTNAAKHAPGRDVDVELAADGQVVALSVVNPLPSPAPVAGTGAGLASIRDRVALLGGRATAGPTPDGAFAVRAVLPLGPALPGDGPAACRLTAVCDCLGCATRRTVLG